MDTLSMGTWRAGVGGLFGEQCGAAGVRNIHLPGATCRLERQPLLEAARPRRTRAAAEAVVQ